MVSGYVFQDNQAAELLTALQHVERSEPERAQTIAVIEQLVRLIALTIYLLSLLYTTSATRCRTSYIKIRYVQWVPLTILYLFFLGPFSKSTTSVSHRISRVECVLATIPPKDPSEPCLFLADLLSQYCSLADFPVIASTTRSDVSFSVGGTYAFMLSDVVSGIYMTRVDEVSLRPPNNMDDDAGRTKKVGATSNKRLRDEDDSEDGDNSKEQKQQLRQGTGNDFGAILDANASMSQELITMTIAVSRRRMDTSQLSELSDKQSVNPEMLGFYRRKTHTLGKEERASPRAHVARPMMGVSYLSTMGMSGLDNDLFFMQVKHI
ncbi:unnamed protein product, partial [Fusarium graminearum]